MVIGNGNQDSWDTQRVGAGFQGAPQTGYMSGSQVPEENGAIGASLAGGVGMGPSSMIASSTPMSSLNGSFTPNYGGGRITQPDRSAGVGMANPASPSTPSSPGGSGGSGNSINSAPAGYNPLQFGSLDQTNALAQRLGGSAVQTRNINVGVSNPNQNMVDFGGGSVMNGGLLNDRYSNHGYSQEQGDAMTRAEQAYKSPLGGGFNGGADGAFNTNNKDSIIQALPGGYQGQYGGSSGAVNPNVNMGGQQGQSQQGFGGNVSQGFQGQQGQQNQSNFPGQGGGGGLSFGGFTSGQNPYQSYSPYGNGGFGGSFGGYSPYGTGGYGYNANAQGGQYNGGHNGGGQFPQSVYGGFGQQQQGGYNGTSGQSNMQGGFDPNMWNHTQSPGQPQQRYDGTRQDSDMSRYLPQTDSSTMNSAYQQLYGNLSKSFAGGNNYPGTAWGSSPASGGAGNWSNISTNFQGGGGGQRPNNMMYNQRPSQLQNSTRPSSFI